MADRTTSQLTLFWHRRDLRLSDNVGLHAAFELSAKVIGVFCLDPHILEGDDVAPARVAYMLGCLRELETAYTALGSRLLVLRGDPRTELPKLAVALSAENVIWNRDVEPYARDRDRTVAAELRERDINVDTAWDQLLHVPGSIRTSSVNSKPYTVFTPFRKNWSRQTKAEPLPAPLRACDLTPEELAIAEKAGATDVPSDAELGLEWDAGFPIDPGEVAACAVLEGFTAATVFEYDTARNFPGVPGTSGMSAALKFGAIGIREVWQATVKASQECKTVKACEIGRAHV